MQYTNLFPAITLSLVMTTMFLIYFPSSSYADNEKYLNCSVPFDCAAMKGLSYPFWGSNRPPYCGHPSFELNCSIDAPLIKITYTNYRLLQVDNVLRTLKVARQDYWNTVCPATIVNTTINFTVFTYNSATTNLTLYYDCPAPSPHQPDTTLFDCSINGTTATNYYSNSTVVNATANLLGACKYNVKVPVLQSVVQIGSNLTKATLVQAINGGFMLGWDANNSLCASCLGTGGQCGYDTSTSKFTCFGSTTGNYFVAFLASFLAYLFRCRLVSFCAFHFS
jgi:hypothetical protein